MPAPGAKLQVRAARAATGEGKRFIYEKVKELGVNMVLLDSVDAWGKHLVEELGGKFLSVDLTYEACLAALVEYREAIDGVMTFAELSVPLASRLACALGLPGPPPDATERARSKASTRQVMRRSGLPGPEMCRVARREDLEQASEKVGFPAVLKPESGAASVGVKKVQNFKEGMLLEVPLLVVLSEMPVGRPHLALRDLGSLMATCSWLRMSQPMLQQKHKQLQLKIACMTELAFQGAQCEACVQRCYAQRIRQLIEQVDRWLGDDDLSGDCAVDLFQPRVNSLRRDLKERLRGVADELKASKGLAVLPSRKLRTWIARVASDVLGCHEVDGTQAPRS